MNYFTFQNGVPIDLESNDYFFCLCEIDFRDALFILISYLNFSEVIALKHTTKYLNEVIDHSVIKYYAKQGLVSNSERFLYYRSIINIDQLKALLMKELVEYHIENDFYIQLLKLAKNESSRLYSNFNLLCKDIQSNILCTFNIDSFINVNKREILYDVLITIAFIRPKINYSKSMNFIVSALITIFDDAQLVFWILLSFIDNIELNFFYSKSNTSYSIQVYQLNYYIKQYLPKLFDHFKKNGIDIDIFISKWMLTVFSSFLSIEVLAKVWDVIIIDKWKAILKFCIALLTIIHNDLMKLDMNGLSKYFRLSMNNIAISYKELLKHYKRYKITYKDLDQLKYEFFIEQLQFKLNDPNTHWDIDQNEYVSQFKIELEAQMNNSKKKMMTLQQKIGQLNKDYENAFEIYEEQLQLCFKIKTKVKGLIESKTGYEIVLSHMKNKELNTKPYKHFDKNKGILSMKFFSSDDNNETEKFSKELKQTIKDLEYHNKLMLDNYEILDKKKYIVEQLKKEKDNCKETIEEISNEIERQKRKLIKNLSQQLQLLSKSLTTSKY